MASAEGRNEVLLPRLDCWGERLGGIAGEPLEQCEGFPKIAARFEAWWNQECLDRPILMLMPWHEGLGNHELDRVIVSGRLHLTLHDLQQLAWVDRIGRRLGCPIPVHLYLDTGMSRSGMNAVQMSTALRQVE